MNLESIEKLMSAMTEKGITRLALKDASGFELELERGRESESFPCGPQHLAQTFSSSTESSVEEARSQKEDSSRELHSKGGHEITSPMVGTFYTAPSPDADPFVKVGDSVTEETVIGIIEAMKVMNEIKAGKKGKVTEIYIDNAHPVEFGTKLLKLV